MQLYEIRNVGNMLNVIAAMKMSSIRLFSKIPVMHKIGIL